jgi:hypothetical protein
MSNNPIDVNAVNVNSTTTNKNQAAVALGSIKSAKKAEASRRNGLKGGDNRKKNNK